MMATTENSLAGMVSVSDSSFEDELGNLAYAVPTAKRRSRFWFRFTEPAQQVNNHKSGFTTKVVDYVDADVQERLATYVHELPPQLQTGIEKVREFFLTEIAPLTLASSGGTSQSREVIERLLDTQVDSALISKFDTMVNKAATIKLALFVVDYFKLPASYADLMLGAQTETKESSEFKKLGALIEQTTKDLDKLGKRVEQYPTKRELGLVKRHRGD